MCGPGKRVTHTYVGRLVVVLTGSWPIQFMDIISYPINGGFGFWSVQSPTQHAFGIKIQFIKKMLGYSNETRPDPFVS